MMRLRLMIPFRCILLICFITLAQNGQVLAQDLVDVRLMDPRGVAHTKATLDTEWNDARSDLIAARRLTYSEAARLKGLLREELTASREVPFCGHSPPYAVTTTKPDGTVTTVTLCGLCGTWARDGELRVLKGKQSLEYLNTLLPMPDVFASVKNLSALMKLDRAKPYYLLQVDTAN